jgi:hypothetical protein
MEILTPQAKGDDFVTCKRMTMGNYVIGKCNTHGDIHMPLVHFNFRKIFDVSPNVTFPARDDYKENQFNLMRSSIRDILNEPSTIMSMEDEFSGKIPRGRFVLMIRNSTLGMNINGIDICVHSRDLGGRLTLFKLSNELVITRESLGSTCAGVLDRLRIPITVVPIGGGRNNYYVSIIEEISHKYNEFANSPEARNEGVRVRSTIARTCDLLRPSSSSLNYTDEEDLMEDDPTLDDLCDEEDGVDVSGECDDPNCDCHERAARRRIEMASSAGSEPVEAQQPIEPPRPGVAIPVTRASFDGQSHVYRSAFTDGIMRRILGNPDGNDSGGN